MRLIRSLALACSTLAVVPALATGAPRLPLGHAGRWITDADGRVVIEHGLNMVYKLPPYYPAAVGFGNDDATFLSSNGFNSVRVGVIWKAVEPQPGVYDDGYLAQIDSTVAMLARHGIVSLLDFHQDLFNERFQGEGAPDWAVQDGGLPNPQLGFPTNYQSNPALQRAFDQFWANSPGPGGVGLQDRFAASWRRVAQRFAGNRALLGYEILNEPFPGTGYLLCALTSGCPGFDGQLSAFDHRVDAAIRTTDRRTLVWYEPNVLFDFGFVTNVSALGDARAGFSWHDYCFSNEAQGCASHATVFVNAAAHVRATGEASMMTEFGSTSSAPDLRSMLALADRDMVPWLEWAYTGFDPTSSAPDQQAIVRDPRKPPTGSNVVLGTLRALVEPYPQVVAGTPQSWSYDPSGSVFSLRYSRARVAGRGAFGTGSVSEIATPALVYERHYGVAVSGGAVLSPPGASLLRVALCPRASSVTVTVTPSGPRRGSCRPRRRAPAAHRS